MKYPHFVVGCAFLTYCKKDSAILAQEALHDKKALPGVSERVAKPKYGMLTTFPQCNFSLEFPEIFSQNHICYH